MLYAKPIFILSDVECKPKVVARWLGLLFHIRKVRGSNHNPQTGCPESQMKFSTVSTNSCVYSVCN